ncbi:MAG: 50S ribosomal protein L21 [Cyanobacteria bacterium P01_H01_bin.15]
MTYAIVETSGTQLRVEPGRFYELNRLAGEPDDAYQIDKVLLVQNGDDIQVGQPYVTGAVIKGKILEHRRGRKVLVYKMKPKKKTRKKRGHRQELTRLLIESIEINGTVIASAQAEAPPVEIVDTPEPVAAE